MNRIEKHTFEAVSLLTVDKGLLELTIVPAVGQPDWIIPSNLILSIEPFSEHIWTYLWQSGQGSLEVAVYSLLPRQQTPKQILILEGNTDVHRIGLLCAGTVRTLQARISDVKDVDSALKATTVDAQLVNLNNASLQITGSEEAAGADTDEDTELLPYLYELVQIDGETFMVPDLDTLAHHLVDLDG